MSKSKKTRNTKQDHVQQRSAKQDHAKQKRSKQKREGIVLLVVLSLLVLFVLVGVTYAIATRMAHRSAKSHAKRDIRGDDPRKELDQAMYQILRDVGDTQRSAAKGHSLLRDEYGSEVLGGELAAPPQTHFYQGGRQFLRFDVPIRDESELSNFSLLEDTYSGLVFSILNGPYPGISTRILRYEPLTAAQAADVIDTSMGGPTDNEYRVRFYVEPFDLTSTQLDNLWRAMDNNAPAIPPTLSGSNVVRFRVNGRPFDGPGYGYVAGVLGTDDTDSDGHLVALTPNFMFSPTGSSTSSPLPNGDADEPYDAVDYQNMFIGMVPPSNASATDSLVIPSFLRPMLINYWRNQGVGWSTDANLRRKVIFRPMPADHPDFSGSNPSLDPASVTTVANRIANLLAGNYDIDNDNDNRLDSIWLDFGLPVKTTADGRLYKALIAPLIIDLDGRINVNAHGNVAHYNTVYRNQDSDLYAGSTGANVDLSGYRGRGFGPADINWTRLLSNPAVAAEQPADRTKMQAIVEMRYGLNKQPGATAADVTVGSLQYNEDYLGFLRNTGMSSVFASTSSTTYGGWGRQSAYGTPMDVFGMRATAADTAGAALYTYLSSPGATLSETHNDPYEMRQKVPSGQDAPFTLAELERLLRMNDADAASLPSRLFNILPAARRAELRLQLTTRSSYVPVPGVVAAPINATDGNDIFSVLYSKTLSGVRNPAYISPTPTTPTVAATSRGRYPSIVELMAAKIVQIGRADSGSVLSLAAVRTTLRQLLPFELFHGEKMNVNRPWSNGINDAPAANNSVDEDLVINSAGVLASETASERIWSESTNTFQFATNNDARYANDDPVSLANAGSRTWLSSVGSLSTTQKADILAREQYARHLYCLMLLMVDLDMTNASTVPGIKYRYIQPMQEGSSLTLSNDVDRRFLTARRIAQWAVNVVDFRDNDATMTAFHFDENPYDGWNPPADSDNWVFGMEAPELLLNETLAFHDRRVKDTKQDSTGKKLADMPMPDNDMDQFRIPQGSLFLEFYCPRGITNPVAPRELYNLVGGVRVLDLDRLSPTAPTGSSRAGQNLPVWRVAISVAHNTNPAISPFQKRGSEAESYSFQPEDTSLLRSVDTRLNIERLVWFAAKTPYASSLENGVVNAGGGPTVDGDAVFWNRTGSPTNLPAGRYAVVGPRVETHIGSQNTFTGDPAAMLINTPSTQVITLATNQVTHTDGPFYPPTSQIQPPVNIIAMSNPPSTWVAADLNKRLPRGHLSGVGRGVGLNITEPLAEASYYSEPQTKLDTSAAGAWEVEDAYHDYDMGTGVLPDQPFDSRPTAPLTNDNLLTRNHTPNYKTAFLQRLANPDLPWNPVPGAAGHDSTLPPNPYITVDWSPIDLTVFNGEANRGSDPDEAGGTASPRFGSRHRGNNTSRIPLIWRANSRIAPAASSNALTDWFAFNLLHSLGYLNPSPTGPPNNRLATGNATIKGNPATPFPTLEFNNRPFFTPLELMNVPASSAARFTHEFNLLPGTDSYRPQPPAGSSPPDPVLNFANQRGRFPHLLNFFNTNRRDTADALSLGANYYRIFDFLETTSPYADSGVWMSPSSLANATTPASAQNTMPPFLAPEVVQSTNFRPLQRTFRPPFTRISKYQDAGRVNLNTVWDTRIYESLMKGYWPLDPRVNGHPSTPQLTNNNLTALAASNTWRQFVLNRRGYDDTSTSSNANPFPTRFAGLYRSAGSSTLAPLNNLRRSSTGNGGVRGTPLRSTGAGASPLLGQGALNSTDPEFLALNPARHAAMANHPISRLGNIASGQSNVYAVWLTVGYFEVTPGAVDRGHPDGYRLGPEIGFDTGEIRRHRGFYIIDRSIPVAFEPGKNHNVDNCVLLRRFIE